MKAIAEGRATGVRTLVKEGSRPLIERAIHRGADETDPCLAAAQVLLRSHDGVVGARLDGLIGHAVDALGRGVEDAKGETGRGTAGELRRRGDRRRRRRARVAVLVAQRRRAADATRVEQSLVGAAVDDDVAVELELIEARSLDEERPLLGIERLERREIEDGGIRLDLAEVGVDGRVERDVRRQAQLQVGAGGEILAAAEARVRQCSLHVLGHDVRRQLDPTVGRDVADAVEPAQLRRESVAVGRVEGPGVAFGAPLEIAPDTEAEGVALPVRIAELGERDAELGRPP